MFNVGKLAKVLKEIFTRDNENFSPELVAEELIERNFEVVDEVIGTSPAGYDMSSTIFIGTVAPNPRSDPREMKCADTPPCDAVWFKAESVDNCYGGPYVWRNEVEIKAVTSSEVAKSLDPAQQEPSLNEREKFHSEAVAWLAETYHKWPAGDNPGCRDWVLVNNNSKDGWFMPFAITLASGCVVYRSEWADFVNKIRPAKKSVVIGNGCTSYHKYAVVIGSNISSDKDYQLKIGSNGIQCSRDISQEEFDEIRKVFSALIGK